MTQQYAEENVFNRFLRSYIQDLPTGQKTYSEFPYRSPKQLTLLLCVENVES